LNKEIWWCHGGFFWDITLRILGRVPPSFRVAPTHDLRFFHPVPWEKPSDHGVTITTQSELDAQSGKVLVGYFDGLVFFFVCDTLPSQNRHVWNVSVSMRNTSFKLFQPFSGASEHDVIQSNEWEDV